MDSVRLADWRLPILYPLWIKFVFVPLTWRKLITYKSHPPHTRSHQLTGVVWCVSNVMSKQGAPKNQTMSASVYPPVSVRLRVRRGFPKLNSTVLRYWFFQFSTCIQAFRRCVKIPSSSSAVDLVRHNCCRCYFEYSYIYSSLHWSTLCHQAPQPPLSYCGSDGFYSSKHL